MRENPWLVFSSRSNMASFFLDSFPGSLHVPYRRVGLTNAHPQRELVVQPRVREVEIATSVQGVHQFLILLIARFQTEADKIQWNWCRHFEARVRLHPFCKLLGQPNMVANMKLQSLNSVIPQHKPQL